MTSLSELGHDERLPRYQQLHDELAERIRQQQWRPGDLLPSEAELTKTYGIATGTVRKAIEALIDEGLVERLHGKGTFVRRPRFDASLFRFFRFESITGERLVPQGRILERAVLPPPPAIAAALKLADGEPAIRLSRLRLVDQQPVLVEEIWLSKARFGALLDIAPQDFGDLLYPMYEQHCGQIVASAGETLTVEAVDPEHARLLQMAPGLPVIVIERLAVGFDGQPLEWRRSRGPGDRFRYYVEIR